MNMSSSIPSPSHYCYDHIISHASSSTSPTTSSAVRRDDNIAMEAQPYHTIKFATTTQGTTSSTTGSTTTSHGMNSSNNNDWLAFRFANDCSTGGTTSTITTSRAITTATPLPGNIIEPLTPSTSSNTSKLLKTTKTTITRQGSKGKAINPNNKGPKRSNTGDTAALSKWHKLLSNSSTQPKTTTTTTTTMVGGAMKNSLSKATRAISTGSTNTTSTSIKTGGAGSILGSSTSTSIGCKGNTISTISGTINTAVRQTSAKEKQQLAAKSMTYYNECFLRGIRPSDAELAAKDIESQYNKWWIESTYNNNENNNNNNNNNKHNANNTTTLTTTTTTTGSQKNYEWNNLTLQKSSKKKNKNNKDNNKNNNATPSSSLLSSSLSTSTTTAKNTTTTTTTEQDQSASSTTTSTKTATTTTTTSGTEILNTKSSISTTTTSSSSLLQQQQQEEQEQEKQQQHQMEEEKQTISREDENEKNNDRSMIEEKKAQLIQRMQDSGGDTTDEIFLNCLKILNEYYISQGHDARWGGAAAATHDHQQQEGRASRDSSSSDNNDSCKMDGIWYTISKPNYSECCGKNDNGESIYTLGRMCFDIFQPNHLLCSLQNTINHVSLPNNSSSSNNNNNDDDRPKTIPRKLKLDAAKATTTIRNYDINVSFTIEPNQTRTGRKVDPKNELNDNNSNEDEDGSNNDNHNTDNSEYIVSRPIRGSMINYGYCIPDPQTPNRLSIWFSGGCLKIHNDEIKNNIDGNNNNDDDIRKIWNAIFNPTADQQSDVSGIAKRLAARFILGLVINNDHKANDDYGKINYILKRPIGGHGQAFVDVIYMDNNLRIMKGHSGIIYVMIKQKN